jgi:hypothetical protein
MEKLLKRLLLLNRPWPLRFWMYSSALAIGYYVVKTSFFPLAPPSLTIDAIILAYGAISLSVYVLIFESKW